MTDRKKGMYYWEEINFYKSGQPHYRASKNFKTRAEAVKFGKTQFKKGRIVQARLWYSKNILSDVQAGDINTKGQYTREDWAERLAKKRALRKLV